MTVITAASAALSPASSVAVTLTSRPPVAAYTWLPVHSPAPELYVPASDVPSPQSMSHVIASSTPGSATAAIRSTVSPGAGVSPDVGVPISTDGGALWTKKSTSLSNSLPPPTRASHPSTRATYSPSLGQVAQAWAISPATIGCTPTGEIVQLPGVPLMPVTCHEVPTAAPSVVQPRTAASSRIGVPSLPVKAGAEPPLPTPPPPVGGGVVVDVQKSSFMSTSVSASLSTPSLHDSGGIVDRLFALITTIESRIWSLVSAIASFMWFVTPGFTSAWQISSTLRPSDSMLMGLGGGFENELSRNRVGLIVSLMESMLTGPPGTVAQLTPFT